MSIITGILWEIIHLFLDMAPYLMLGMLLAGILHIAIRKEFIARHIGTSSLGAVIKSSLFGVPLPLCSCGVVPTAVFLSKAGASRPAVVSFLISTPQTGIDSIIAAYGLLGPAMAIARPVAAFFSGIFGGVVSFIPWFSAGRERPDEDAAVGEVNDECDNEACCSSCGGNAEKQLSEQRPGFRSRLKELFDFGFIEFTDDIAIPFAVGLLIAGIISFLIPDDFFAGTIAADGIFGMLLMVVIGIPFYICSTSSIPIAVTLILKGISPGAAFVFLMAGPATNAATLGILKRQFGLRMVLAYLFSIIAGSVAFGYLIDRISASGLLNFFDPASAAFREGGESSIGAFTYVVSALFLLLLLFSYYRKVRVRFASASGESHSHAHSDSCC